MTDNLVSMDRFRVLKKEEEDKDDEIWKQSVLKTLDDIRERVVSGETAALMISELQDEISSWRLHLLGLGDYDTFTIAGILEMTKLQVLDSVYDE